MGKIRSASLGALLLALAGCSALAPTPTRTEYLCAGAQRFAVTYAADEHSATIELARVHFSLVRERSGPEVQRYTCSVLTLTRRGALAEVNIQDDKAYRDCREQR